jgi:transposase-like protein
MELLFNNLLELNEYFSTENKCWEYLESLRWSEKPICPFCNNETYYHFKDSHTYKCKACKKKFNAKIGTIFENTKIPLKKWFLAIYIATSHKKGISSCQLSKDISVTQKTAWFILHRIREMLKVKAPRMLDDMVEVDETYIGGKDSNKHKVQRDKLTKGTTTKTPVLAILGRQTYVITKVVNDTKIDTLQTAVVKRVGSDSTVVTDAYPSYQNLSYYFKKHETVNHLQNEWAKGDLHTNTVEGFFSQLKRGIYGIYHQVSPKHLHRYCQEFSYRYNTRKIKEVERFNHSLTICNKRLKYQDLIRKAI